MHKLDIVNLSLTTMGLDPIVSLDYDSNTVKYINVIYEPVKRFCLSLHNWNFALKRTRLNQLADNEQSDLYQYAYGEPSDILKIASLRDSNNEFVEYVELNNVIYSNANPVYLTYVFNADESVFTDYFVEVMKYKLSAELSMALFKDPNVYNNYYKLFEVALRTARGLDSERGKINKIYNSGWMAGL